MAYAGTGNRTAQSYKASAKTFVKIHLKPLKILDFCFKNQSKYGIIFISKNKEFQRVNQSAKDIQFRELKDTISQLKTTIASQNQLIQSLQKAVEAAGVREANLNEQIEYLTKKLFGSSSEKRSNV